MTTTRVSFAVEFGDRVSGDVDVSLFPCFTLTEQSNIIEEGNHNA